MRLCFSHSSPFVIKILFPNILRTLYSSDGFGNFFSFVTAICLISSGSLKIVNYLLQSFT